MSPLKIIFGNALSISATAVFNSSPSTLISKSSLFVLSLTGSSPFLFSADVLRCSTHHNCATPLHFIAFPRYHCRCLFVLCCSQPWLCNSIRVVASPLLLSAHHRCTNPSLSFHCSAYLCISLHLSALAPRSPAILCLTVPLPGLAWPCPRLFIQFLPKRNGLSRNFSTVQYRETFRNPAIP